MIACYVARCLACSSFGLVLVGGTFVAVPVDDPSLPSYTGTFTVWGGFNANGKTVNGTFTMTVHGTGSDGSSFKVHETDHFNTTPTGAEFFFTRCHD